MLNPDATPAEKLQELEKLGLYSLERSMTFGKYNSRWWFYRKGDEIPKGKKVGDIINPVQGMMMGYTGREFFYGGAPGGAKTATLLMKALRNMHIPGWSSLLIRRTFPEMVQPGGLIHMGKEWIEKYDENDIRYVERDHQIVSKEGGVIQFNHCDSEADISGILGGSYQFIGEDECTWIFPLLLSEIYARRRRKLTQKKLELQIGLASNPGGPFEDFYMERHIQSVDPNVLFMPAYFTDNGAIDQDEYAISLDSIPDEFRKRQLKDAVWGLKRGGNMFDPNWCEMVSEFSESPPQVRSWDTAGTDGKRRANRSKSDETVGTLWRYNHKRKIYGIAHQIYFRADTGTVEDVIDLFITIDNETCRTMTVEEKPPGEAGIDRAKRRTQRFAGKPYKCGGELGRSFHTSKAERADAMAVACKNGLVKILKKHSSEDPRVIRLIGSKITRGNWWDRLLAQMGTFPQDNFPDDGIDSASLGFNEIAFMARPSPIFHAQTTSYDDKKYVKNMLYGKIKF